MGTKENDETLDKNTPNKEQTMPNQKPASIKDCSLWRIVNAIIAL